MTSVIGVAEFAGPGHAEHDVGGLMPAAHVGGRQVYADPDPGGQFPEAILYLHSKTKSSTTSIES